VFRNARGVGRVLSLHPPTEVLSSFGAGLSAFPDRARILAGLGPAFLKQRWPRKLAAFVAGADSGPAHLLFRSG